MTAPIRATPRLSAVPASQNTAPVAEFRCLFTHDTRKKQKKWQDGYVKFHSFNSRVIVYDASRFTVGDTYYKEADGLHEGDELMLDKGVMVEVAEPMGVTQTDLTPLFDRKPKDTPQTKNAPVPQKTLPRPAMLATNPLRAASQSRHKSLNALLGTSKGPIGKSVPIRSPYEERIEKENQQIEERAPKRQKTAHRAPAQQPVRPSAAISFARPLRDIAGTNPPPQPIPSSATVINLSSQPEVDNLPSDVTLPCTPSKSESWVRPAVATNATIRRELLPKPNHVHTTPKIPKGKVPIPQTKQQQTPRAPPPLSSPPVSASNRIANVEFAIQVMSDPPQEPSPVRSPPKPPAIVDPLQNRKKKTLKLSTGTKRGMLLCQSVPVRRQTIPDEPKGETSRPLQRVKEVRLRKDCSDIALRKDTTIVNSISNKGSSVTMPARAPAEQSNHIDPSAIGTAEAPLEILDDAPLKILSNPELVHGYLDQQLLVSPSPPDLQELTKSKSPPISKPAVKKPNSTKKAPKSSKRANETPIEDPASKKKKPKVTQSKTAPAKHTKSEKAKAPALDPSRSPSPAPTSNTLEKLYEVTSPVPSKSTTKRPQNVSTSVSPNRLAALSTGGFKKKPKATQARTTASAVTALSPCTTVPTLPPHPLRSSKNGPLMSATELSALLDKGPRSMRLEDDPIEDASQVDNMVSPSKRSGGFKRSRSENDAPIPSTSDEWEQRNLPKNPNPPDDAPTTAVTAITKPKKGGLAALIKKTDPRKKFQRAQTLSVATGLANGNSERPEVVTPPLDDDVGPWSTEAFDLFDWRPPGKEWISEGTKMKLVDTKGEEAGVGMLVDGR